MSFFLFLDHNGFTHQDPGFLGHVISKKPDIIRIYLPPDANCLLSVMHHSLKTCHKINVVVAGKHPAPQWLTIDEARSHCAAGLGIWDWASNDKGCEPDIVMASAGDVPALEALAATSILRKRLPHLKIRFVNVVNLMKLCDQEKHPHGLNNQCFNSIFTLDKPVIFAFHGVPHLVEKLIFRRHGSKNFTIRGYNEEGTISTPFDMTVMNKLDRFHLVIDVCNKIEYECKSVKEKTRWSAVYVKQEMEQLLIKVRGKLVSTFFIVK
jgi:xylulose-5-phosphate/fructose-6-phosphate phosphoketolase